MRSSSSKTQLKARCFTPQGVRLRDVLARTVESSPDSSAHFHDDYVYFSSFSSGWVEHARQYVE